MANSLPATQQPVATGLPVSGAWAKWLLPSFSDCLFLAVLFWLFAAGAGGWMGLLADGDAGWHIRAGEWILENGSVPHVDLFSFSKSGQPWYAWEWLSDVVFALLHSAAGLKGIIILAALLIAGFGAILFRHMIWSGATPFAALLVSLLVYGASSIHYLARPHVFTLFGMTIALWIIHADRKAPSYRIWTLVPIMLAWVNLHGGFLALIAILGLLVAGTVAEEALRLLMDGAVPDWRQTKRYGLLLAVCSGLTFVNPYGWNLHLHVFAYLRSDWIKNTIQEFQSPVFRGESAMQYELMLFAGLATVAWLVWNRQIAPALFILFWAHSSLMSVRHVPLYMIVAGPYVALGLTALWQRYIEPAGKKTIRGIFASLATDMTPGCARTSAWIAIAAIALPLLPDTSIKWPADFPAVKFPAAMVARYHDSFVTEKTLTMDQWADYMIYRAYPKQKVFVDGRSDFYGKEIGEEYLHMSQGMWDWNTLLNKHAFELVLSPIEWPLASLLKNSPNWSVVQDDGQAVLFRRKH